MEFQPSAPRGFVFCACVCVCHVFVCVRCRSPSKRSLWSLIMKTDHSKKLPADARSLDSFSPHFWAWARLVSVADCVVIEGCSACRMNVSFCDADVSLCVLCCWWWKEGEWGGAQEAGCYIFCQMSSMYLKPCVKDGCGFVKRLCVRVFFSFQTRPLFSLAAFCPKFQFGCPWEGIQIMRNTIRMCCSASLE